MFENFKLHLKGTYENKEVDYWLQLKGEQKYLELLYLLDEEDRCWLNVKDLYRYDKRLQSNIFRYFCMFEEYLRALMSNQAGDINIDDTEKLCQIFKIEPKFKNKKILKLHRYLDKLDFFELIPLVINIQDMHGYQIEKFNLQNNLLALKSVRNCICHNRLLLLEQLSECSINGVHDNSLC